MENKGSERPIGAELPDGVSPEVADYVETCIIPRYASFDRAHREDHVRMVIEQSLKLARKMPGLIGTWFMLWPLSMTSDW